MEQDNVTSDTFVRREGTSSQHGWSFQNQMVALFLARALARDPAARVGAEHKYAGVFDDVSVLLRPTPNHPPVLLLIQLKHKDDNNNVPPRVGSQSLRGDSGNFAVRKYYRSYVNGLDTRRLGAEPTNTYYVLFTNAELPDKVLVEAPVGHGGLPRTAARLLNTGCGGSEPRVLAPHADHLKGERRAPEFQARFILMGSQASDAELMELLTQELTQHMRRVPSDAAERARSLVREVEEWYKATGHVPYLTADWAPWQRTLFDCDAPLLRELRFHDPEISRLTSLVADTATGTALLLVSDTSDAEVRAAKMAQAAAGRPLLLARYGVAAAADVEVALGLWERGWSRELALVLPEASHPAPEEAVTHALGTRLLAALGNEQTPARPDDARGRALVILAPPKETGRVDHPLVMWLRERLLPRARWLEMSDLVAFRLLAPAARAAVLRSPALFQGRACALQDLRQEHVLDAELRGDSLARLLRAKEPLRIGRPLALPPASGDDLYVSRRLEKRVAVRAEVLRAQGLRDVFVVKGASPKTLQALAPPGALVQLLDRHQSDTRFVACRRMKWDKFNEFCREHPGRRCHFLRMEEDGELTWRQSGGQDNDERENPLLDYLDAEGNELSNNTAFIKDCVSCTPFEVSLACSHVRTVLVSGMPGAGKSETLRRVAQFTAETRPGDWVVRLSLADHADALAAAETESPGAAAAAAEALLRSAAGLTSGPAHPDDDLLAVALLRDRLWQSGGLRVLVDAFDEISPDYTETVLAILTALQDSFVASLWISSREVMEDHLEAELGVRAFRLKPLTVSDQEHFWVKYWAGPLRSKLPREELKQKAKLLLNDLGGRFRSHLRMNEPLHTNIMANLFGRGFLSGSCEESLLYKDILFIYNKFVEWKFEIYCKEKVSIIAIKMVKEQVLDLMHRDFMEKHKMCGLLVSGIFNFLQSKVQKDICSKTEDFISDIQKGKEKTGIIIGVSCGKPRFIHRTFAEYFAARWIVEHHAENPGILEVLMQHQFKFVKCLTDQLMSKQHKLHQCVLNDDVNTLKEILLNSHVDVDAVDIGGRNALILAVQKNTAEGYEMSRLLLERGATVLGDKEIYCAAMSKAWNNVKLLLNHGIALTKSVVGNKDVQNVLDIAFAKKIITEEEKNIRHFDINWNIFSKGRSLLHLAVLSGAKKSTDALIEMGANLDSKDHLSNTPLHYAVLHNDEEMVDKLLSQGVFVHQNIQGKTPLFIACSLGLISIINKLIKHGASMNARSKTHSTLLHASVDHLDVMEILLKHEIDVDAVDSRGHTVLHEATYRKNVQLISLLLKRGAKVDCLNFQLETPLFIAVTNDCISCATLLIKAGACLSNVTSNGNTPLHVAIKKNNISMTSLLLESGANVCIQNYKGDSPIDFALLSDVKEIQDLISSKAQKNMSKMLNKSQNNILNGPHKTMTSHQKGYWEEDEDDVDGRGKNFFFQPLASSQLAKTPEPTVSSAAAADLLAAIKRKNLRNIKTLLHTAQMDVWGALDSMGDTALHFAVRTSTPQVVSTMINYAPPAALAARNAAGDTPAHVAASRRVHDISLSLLARGADPCAGNAIGDTPLHIACRLANYKQVRYMTPRLPEAVLKARNNEGDTPLHLALALGKSNDEQQLDHPPPGASHGQLLIVYEYDAVECRWVVEGEGEQQHSRRASSRAHLAKTILEESPAMVLSMGNVRGDTPLHMAARGRVHGADGANFIVRSYWSAGMMRSFLAHEPNVSIANKEGDTVLHLFCRNPGDLAAMGFLLKSKGADVALAATNARGDTPLHEAAAHCLEIEIVRDLVEAGANPWSKNSNGETPLAVAERANNFRVTAYFNKVLCNTPSHLTARRLNSLLKENQMHDVRGSFFDARTGNMESQQTKQREGGTVNCSSPAARAGYLQPEQVELYESIYS